AVRHRQLVSRRRHAGRTRTIEQRRDIRPANGQYGSTSVRPLDVRGADLATRGPTYDLEPYARRTGDRLHGAFRLQFRYTLEVHPRSVDRDACVGGLDEHRHRATSGEVEILRGILRNGRRDNLATGYGDPNRGHHGAKIDRFDRAWNPVANAQPVDGTGRD